MLAKLRARDGWKFFAALPRADRPLAFLWWMFLALRGLLPVGFAVAMGMLVGAVQRGDPLLAPLILVGSVFVLLQIGSPLHQAIGANLGSRTAAWLNDELTRTCIAPPGMGHLEDPRLTTDLTMARDFDLGIMGPPISISMGFIASGLVEMVAGIASACLLVGYAWWAPFLLAGAWGATHWLLREAAVWKDRNTDEVREAQRDADYSFRLAVDPPPAKELRLFGLADWTVNRFAAQKRRLVDLRWHATRLREQPVAWSLLIVLGANALLFWSMASDAALGLLSLAQLVTFASAAVSTSMIAFGGLSWALDGAAAPVAAVLRLQGAMATAGALSAPPNAVSATAPTQRVPSAANKPTSEIRFRNVSFGYPSTGTTVLKGLDLTIPAGSSLAIVGQNGAGKTTFAKLLCRLYDPTAGAIEIDGVDLRDFPVDDWRKRVTAVFQDFVRFELSVRDNVAPAGAPDDIIKAALSEAGAGNLASLDTILAKGYEGSTDLSGGQWQRIALARALCAVRLGAGVVLLDEPTAQLDVRGEAEIFERILKATRHATTILISHRFSTVRQADRICVLENGHVIELGSHDELIALGGRYRTMFDLQASRFGVDDEQDGSEQQGVPLDGIA